MALRQSEICDLILYELYELAADPNTEDDIPPFDFADFLSFDDWYVFSHRFYELALDDISSLGRIEKTGVLPDHMGITDEGIRYVERELDDKDSLIFKHRLDRKSNGRDLVPASNRFVELDHNQTDYKDAVDAMDILKDALISSNSFPDILDRDRRIGELEAGKRLLSEMRIDPNNVNAILYGTLAYLVTSFANEPIGELAKIAWEAVKKLFGD
ncbi:MAG: hypothetical protein ABJN98_22995 [Roseibium sp.]